MVTLKVTVRIHTDHGLEFRSKKIGDNNRVQMKRKPPWSFVLKDFEVKHKHFGRAQYYCDVWENAPESWSYEHTMTPDKQPELTQKQITEMNKADIFKRRYGTPEKTPSTALMYIILIATIGLGIVQILISTGRLRI